MSGNPIGNRKKSLGFYPRDFCCYSKVNSVKSGQSMETLPEA